MMLETGSVGPEYTPVTTPFEVATVVRWIGPDVFIPMHDPYRVFTEKVIEYVKAAAPYVRVVDMNPGETIRYRPFQLEKI
jgi:L-ascorbate metabolism protein UlaG (beta-lactamase superfamily)